jgi:hypothetical protein
VGIVLPREADTAEYLDAVFGDLTECVVTWPGPFPFQSVSGLGVDPTENLDLPLCLVLLSPYSDRYRAARPKNTGTVWQKTVSVHALLTLMLF